VPGHTRAPSPERAEGFRWEAEAPSCTHTPCTAPTRSHCTSPTAPQHRQHPPAPQPSPGAGGGCHCAVQRCTHGLTAPTTSERDTGGWSGAQGWSGAALRGATLWARPGTSPLPRSAARHTPHTARAVRGAGTTTRAGGRWRADARRCAVNDPATMPRMRAQRLRETMTDDGWAGMPDELFEKVLEAAAGWTE
jgi:hypothetical protein